MERLEAAIAATAGNQCGFSEIRVDCIQCTQCNQVTLVAFLNKQE